MLKVIYEYIVERFWNDDLNVLFIFWKFCFIMFVFCGFVKKLN